MSRISCVYFFSVLAVLSGCRRSSDTAEISIEEVWSRPVMIAAAERAGAIPDSDMTGRHHSSSNGVVYLLVQNHGGAADRLLRARSEVCEVTEIHQTTMDGDRLMMQKVDGGIEIPARGNAKLAPRGYHIMLMGLKNALAVGDSFAVQLEFEKSGLKTVFSKIRQP